MSSEERYELNPYDLPPVGREGQSMTSFPTMGISIMKHTPQSSSWRVTQTLTQFVEETFKEFDLHESATDDDSFRFKLNSCSSIIAKCCRRGRGNSVYLGKGVKFGPMVSQMIDSGTSTIHQIHDAPWVPEGKLLMLYQGNKLDVPFISNDYGILVNENVSSFGRLITVPESQLA